MSTIFGATRQIGCVVKDIEAGIIAALDQFGVGPFFIVREVRPTWFRYRGAESAPPLLSLAFAFSGDVQFEIIQQHDDPPSAYREFLNSGREGIQHVSSWASSHQEFDELCAQATDRCGVAIHEGQIGMGRFAYFDALEPIFGLSFEIAEMMLPGQVPIWDKVLRASKGWDGSNPIRNLR
jgi:hypothetical protein